MTKSSEYHRAEVLAQQLVNHIAHPRVSGTISYGDQGDHCVRVEIYSKSELLSQGKRIVTIEHDSKLQEVTARTHKDFHEQVHHILVEFTASVNGKLIVQD